MITPFLQSMEAAVRTAGQDGTAQHVNASTADELRLLAEMFRQAPAGITPADIAWAWLKLSRCDISKEPGKLSHWWEAELHLKVGRAAECAELAVIAACLDSHSHRGTQAGARAAWNFIANALMGIKEAVPIMRALGMQAYEFVAIIQPMADRYRRELATL